VLAAGISAGQSGLSAVQLEVYRLAYMLRNSKQQVNECMVDGVTEGFWPCRVLAMSGFAHVGVSAGVSVLSAVELEVDRLAYMLHNSKQQVGFGDESGCFGHVFYM
jgi:hypothetical protein